MSANATAVPQQARVNNLALVFQEAITVVLRTRFRVQAVENPESFRAVMRKMISSAAKDANAMGYSSDASKMAVYAIIAFLDESILRSREPIFADWHKMTLQQEMFGSQVAGEYFYRNVIDLLNRPGSVESADILELHGLCLLLGYRGKYEQGDATEVHTILRRIRDKIASVRGPAAFFQFQEAPQAPKVVHSDPWVRRLAITAIAAALVTAALYIGYMLLLDKSVPLPMQSRVVSAPAAYGPSGLAATERLTSRMEITA